MKRLPRRCEARISPIDGNGKTRSPFCRKWAVKGSTSGRCELHGGRSPGPRSQEGKAIVMTALLAGRRKWLAERTTKGVRVPWGRKPKLKVERAALIEAKRLAREAKLEAERLAAMSPLDRKREMALAAIARMKANLRANREAGR